MFHINELGCIQYVEGGKYFVVKTSLKFYQDDSADPELHKRFNADVPQAIGLAISKTRASSRANRPIASADEYSPVDITPLVKSITYDKDGLQNYKSSVAVAISNKSSEQSVGGAPVDYSKKYKAHYNKHAFNLLKVSSLRNRRNLVGQERR